MDNAERTLEMNPSDAPAPPTAAVPPNGATSERVRPVFPDARNIESRIPPFLKRTRPSPMLDPLGRARLSRAAKWMLLAAILFFIMYLPAYFYSAADAFDPESSGNLTGYFLSAILAAATFAAALATSLPRMFRPDTFGRWYEPVEAVRDWAIVGVGTGLVYWLAIFAANKAHFGAQSGTLDPRTMEMHTWIAFRLPLLIIAGIFGVIAAQRLAIRREGVISESIGMAAGQVLLQVVLLSLLERPFEYLALKLGATPHLELLFGLAALICLIAPIVLVTWALSVDSSLTMVRRRRGATGINDGNGPVDMTLTVIGGRESGKTVLLAAAFYEWSTQSLGNLRITPAQQAATGPHKGHTQSIANLEDVARELYVNDQFPVGTVSTQNLPFNLSLGQEHIARFTFLDYPGGAIAGRVAESGVIQEFWERVDDTDGVVMIADMSYVRRAKKDNDWLEVRNAYRTVMQRLVDRNGTRRVVPVALVLTKCDEFIDPATGHIDVDRLKAGLEEFQYDDLEEEWRRLNEQSGPGFSEFSTWITSAITYSQPQMGSDNRPDYSKPFQIASPPPSITPTGCASPLLWMTSKVMRWNATLFYDFSTFVLGSTPSIRRRVDAVLELERIAEERAGRA